MEEGKEDKQRMKLLSEQEFIVRFGLLIAAAGFGDNGKELWSGDKKDESAWGLKRRVFGCQPRGEKLPNACIRNNKLSLLSNN